jgi:uncharacterized protein YegP (UPF0339 family)
MEFFNEGRPPLNSTIRYFRVDRREIGFFRFILEACDGLAALRTLDSRKGLIAVHIAPGCEADFTDLAADLEHSFRIKAVNSDTIQDDAFL